MVSEDINIIVIILIVVENPVLSVIFGTMTPNFFGGNRMKLTSKDVSPFKPQFYFLFLSKRKRREEKKLLNLQYSRGTRE